MHMTCCFVVFCGGLGQWDKSPDTHQEHSQQIKDTA